LFRSPVVSDFNNASHIPSNVLPIHTAFETRKPNTGKSDGEGFVFTQRWSYPTSPRCQADRSRHAQLVTLRSPIHITEGRARSVLQMTWWVSGRHDIHCPNPNVLERTRSSWGRTDTQRNVLSGLTRKRQLRSKIWWFTEFCNSHYVSHFAAFFIGAETKISVAKSCSVFRKWFFFLLRETHEEYYNKKKNRIRQKFIVVKYNRGDRCAEAWPTGHISILVDRRTKTRTARAPHHIAFSFLLRTQRRFNFGLYSGYKSVNDPSAGSPTETLLRLLLPLSE
jgi:hypothetical protein